jgi:hypothetical protein
MGQSEVDLFDSPGLEGPVEPGAPDGEVRGAGVEAGAEPGRGLLEAAGTTLEVRQPEPDAVVAGRVMGGFLEHGEGPLDRHRLEVEHPEASKDADRVGSLS